MLADNDLPLQPKVLLWTKVLPPAEGLSRARKGLFLQHHERHRPILKPRPQRKGISSFDEEFKTDTKTAPREKMPQSYNRFAISPNNVVLQGLQNDFILAVNVLIVSLQRQRRLSGCQ